MPTPTIEYIQQQLAEHQEAIEQLRAQGIRILATGHISGQDAIRWLVRYGMTEDQARTEIVKVIRERQSRNRK